MLYCYYYGAVGSNPAGHKKKYTHFIFTLLACIGLYGPAWTQTTVASTDVTALLSERTALVEQGQSTRELDQQLFDAGYRPKAVVNILLLENGTQRVTFPTYLMIPEDKKDRIISRLSAHMPYLSAMVINTTLREVTFFVPATVSQEELNAVFDHFGYLGYEAH
jgi:hypothetical protein